MKNVIITPVQVNDYYDLAAMVGELLQEIMDKVNIQAFNFNAEETKQRAKDFISKEKYWVFIAKNIETTKNLGFVSLYESYALYSEGVYGTIPELYVRPDYRSEKIGNALIKRAIEFGEIKSWSRLEVTTPPLPQFDRTLRFYEAHGFEISGGRKLKINITT